MSDRTPVPSELAQLIAELRAPIPVDPSSRRRLMEAVRRASVSEPSGPGVVAAPSRARGRSHALAAIRRVRSGGAPRRASAGALATAAGIAVLLAVGGRAPAVMSPAGGSAAVVLGDTVAGALRDTLRMVQFILTAPAASRVALAGDFNGWNPRTTPLARTSRDGRWQVTLALTPGRHAYAYVVDDTQWVRDPVGTPAEPNELAPPKSVLVIER